MKNLIIIFATVILSNCGASNVSDLYQADQIAIEEVTVFSEKLFKSKNPAPDDAGVLVKVIEIKQGAKTSYRLDVTPVLNASITPIERGLDMKTRSYPVTRENIPFDNTGNKKIVMYHGPNPVQVYLQDYRDLASLKGNSHFFKAVFMESIAGSKTHYFKAL